jgi:hypothetical protein
MAVKDRSRGENELHGLWFIVALWPRKIREILARGDPLIRVEQIGSDVIGRDA